MSRMFSIKSAAVICVATLVMCFSATDANAQCRGGGGGYGVGYGARSIGYSSGYRGVNNFNRVGGYGVGGFGRSGVSINVGRSYVSPVSRGGNFYGNYRSPYSRSRFGY